MDAFGTTPKSRAGTTPTSRGGRIFLPSFLPPAEHAPQAYCDLIEEYAPAYVRMQKLRDSASKVASELKRAEATWIQEAAEAQRQGKTKKDPRPAIRARLEEAQEATLVAEQVCIDLSQKIHEVRNDPEAQSWWKGATDAARADLLERAARQRDELEETLAECGEVDWIAAWARGSHKPSRAVLGVGELGKLATLIEQHADRRPTRFVSTAENRKLRAGEDAVDVEGVPITYEEADSLYRAGKLKVNPGKPLPRSSTGFGDVA